ncbi:MAG TPA: BON domain-containing protein [Bryobacteraceae bacterium]|nr:BON domain-containing protein [Bryobacteraceae bacterium]
MRALNGKFVFFAALAAIAAPMFASGPKAPPTLADKVRHELNMLPYYTVFDDVSFRVDGSTVTLFGDVTQPWLKSDAGNAVKRLEGVTRVDNEIKVLPLSPMDHQIRMAEYRAIYGFAPLQRYGVGNYRAIRIIVDNGHVRLVGTVASNMDKQLAYQRANGVPNVFSVQNDLQVAP